MRIDTIRQLLIEQLQDIYDAEVQLAEAMPRLAQAASSRELRRALCTHLAETQGHVERLREVFSLVGAEVKGTDCTAMKCLVEESSKTLELDASPEFRDAALISIAQRVEHYEIAAYGSARTLAEHLDMPRAATLLQDTLDEEIAADETYTGISLAILERVA